MYITPKSPKRVAQNTILPVKFKFCGKKFTKKFLCVKTASGKVVATSLLFVFGSFGLQYCSDDTVNMRYILLRGSYVNNLLHGPIKEENSNRRSESKKVAEHRR